MKAISRIWNSPTINTWGSFFVKALSLVLLIPLILNKFSTAEIAIWYLFSAIIGLQGLADLGFGSSFIRVIAYATGGIKDLESLGKKQYRNKGPNFVLLDNILSTMKFTYKKLTIYVAIFITIIGTLSVNKLINQSDMVFEAWLSWTIIIIVTTISFWGRTYSNYLQGANHITLLRRWEAILAFLSIISSAIVIFLGGKLLTLVIVHQSWVIINVFINKYLCNRLYHKKYNSIISQNINDIYNAVWKRAWRSGLGVLMSYGVIQSSGLIYAQIGTTAEIASYLLGLKIIQTISSFSRAPFYSKIPHMSRLFSENNIGKLLMTAQRGMFFSHVSYVIVFISVGLFFDEFLVLIQSNAAFVSESMWMLMGIAFFLERYGAMHIQLYSTSNQIIWHIANGVSGVLYILSSLLLFSKLGIYAFPIGMIVGNLGFYTWYSAIHAYKEFKMDFMSFESKTSLCPALGIIIYAIINKNLW